jgi:hypothetical protein
MFGQTELRKGLEMEAKESRDKLVAWAIDILIHCREANEPYDGMSDAAGCPDTMEGMADCLREHSAGHPDDDESSWGEEFCPFCSIAEHAVIKAFLTQPRENQWYVVEYGTGRILGSITGGVDDARDYVNKRDDIVLFEDGGMSWS